MKPTRRGFLTTTALAPLATQKPPGLDAFRIARRHRIIRTEPAPNFFEGMLLGNGDIGVCVTLRPDALGLHLGKEDSWDIRVSEDHYQHVLHFNDLLKLWERAGQEAKRQGKPEMLFLETSIDFFREYTQKVASSYRKPWPRPWPCGLVWIHWDPRMLHLVRQVLDPSDGLLTIDLEHDDLGGSLRKVRLLSFVNQTTGHVSVSTDAPAPIISVAYYPNIDREANLPPPETAIRAEPGFAEFSCYQHFPAVAEARSEKDRNFALCGRLSGDWSVEGASLRSTRMQLLRLDLTLATPRDYKDNVAHARREAARLSRTPIARLQKESEQHWRQFWSQIGRAHV